MPENRLMINLPPEKAAGHYADFVAVWHTRECFVLDFAAMIRPPEPLVIEGGEQAVGINTEVVTRVRIPPSQVFEMMKALENQLSDWEKAQGIRPGGSDPTQQ